MRVLKTLLSTTVVCLMLLFLIAAFGVYSRGFRLLSVQSNSMKPVFSAGDAVLMQPVSAEQLKDNDIVSFRSPADPRVIVSHRLVDINSDSGRLYTKGDNENVVDEAVSFSQVVGKVTHVVPAAGYVLDMFHQPIGILTVYAAGTLILISELRRLSRRLSRPVYRLHGHASLRHRRA